MIFKLKFAAFALLTCIVVSCNSNKKKVEADNKDYSNFTRVGTIDTMQDKELLPGNIKSIDEYVVIANKGLRNDLREITEGASKTSVFIGGKANAHIKTSIKKMDAAYSNFDFIYKDGNLIYAESKEVAGSESVMYKYYFDKGNLFAVYKASVNSGDGKSSGGTNFQKTDVPAGKAAELIEKEKQARQLFTTIAPYKAKVVKNGEKYSAVTCYDGKEYTLEDKNGFLGKTFKDHPVEAGKFILINLRGNIDATNKSISVQAGDYLASENSGADCF